MRVVIHYDRPELFLGELEQRFPDVTFVPCPTYEALPAILDGRAPEVFYGIIFAGRLDYPRDAMLATRSLKWISVGGSGTDHLAPWDPSLLTVTNSAGVAAPVMAEYVLGALLSLSLGFPGFDAARREMCWQGAAVKPIGGKTAAIIGMGKTGLAVAHRLSGMGLSLIGVRANPGPCAPFDNVVGPNALHEALAAADFVVLCLPLTAATRHCIDEAAIAAMKPGALLVDVSRGGVVKGAALAAGLASGHVAGAALDVFETEPLPADSPFWDLPNVIITPHCSAVYDGWERRSAEMFADNLARYIAGAPLENIVDPRRGY